MLTQPGVGLSARPHEYAEVKLAVAAALDVSACGDGNSWHKMWHSRYREVT